MSAPHPYTHGTTVTLHGDTLTFVEGNRTATFVLAPEQFASFRRAVRHPGVRTEVLRSNGSILIVSRHLEGLLVFEVIEPWIEAKRILRVYTEDVKGSAIRESVQALPSRG